jgi:hypothetical protein
MATFELPLDITLTATPATETIVITDAYTSFNIISSGSVTIAGTTNITTSGTLAEGHTLNFHYTATILGGTVTILGTAVPTHLLQKEFEVKAYYTGSAWELTWIPSANQTAIILPAALTEVPSPTIDYLGTAATTINAAGQQALATLTIPADTFDTRGQSFTLKAWGATTTTAAELKTIDVEFSAGGTGTLYTNAVVTDIIGAWVLEVTVLFNNMTTGEVIPSGVLSAKGNTAVYVDPYTVSIRPTGYDETVSQDIIIYGTEATPSGGQITIEGAILIKN